jgi:PAT family beta-lactamase induction signal transducer AmpG
MVPLGLASGVPLALTGATLQAWLTVEGVDLRTIGLLTLVGLPYAVKFLWAPLMDRFVPPWLGRRRGWMALTQCGVAAGLAAMAGTDPSAAPWLLAGVALSVAFLSASQDIVFDAYRADVLRPAERGLGAALSVTGYRLGMLLSGAVALILSEQIGWARTYGLMALIMAVAVGATWLSPEPEAATDPPTSLTEAVAGPLRELLARPAVPMLLALIVCYKLGDAFAGSLTTAFLIRGVDFTPTDVGLVNKGMGLLATIAGALTGGALMARIGLFAALLWFGVGQALSNLTFMALAWVGKSYPVMVAAVAVENLAGGMGTAAFVALLIALCDARYSATQFALLSALGAMGRVLVGPPAAFLVEAVGWVWFFLVTVLVALPGLALLLWLRGDLLRLGRSPGEGGDETGGRTR